MAKRYGSFFVAKEGRWETGLQSWTSQGKHQEGEDYSGQRE